MKETRSLMGMPITVEIVDSKASQALLDDVFAYFAYVDNVFSVYKPMSQISQINRGLMEPEDCIPDVQEVLQLCEETKKDTDGYFNIRKPGGGIDPSGLVKGWAIRGAARILDGEGCGNFSVEAGGDLQVRGLNADGGTWRVGIRNPFKKGEIVKVVELENCGIATSGTYIRGQHIYNPFKGGTPITDIVSFTVIGPDVYEADRFATAAFAMGKEGISLIERTDGLEGYMIDAKGTATMTSRFDHFVPSYALAD